MTAFQNYLSGNNLSINKFRHKMVTKGFDISYSTLWNAAQGINISFDKAKMVERFTRKKVTIRSLTGRKA